MVGSNERDIGALTEAVNTLKTVVDDLRKDVVELNITVAQVKGGWKVISGVSALSGGAIGAAMIKFAPLLSLMPK
jgi:archaellum component FlaC